MRIALFTDGIHPFTLGGIQKHSAMLVKHLLLLNHQVVLVTFSENDLNKQKLIDSLGLHEEAAGALKLVIVPFPSVVKFPGHYILESYLFSKQAYLSILQEFDSIDFFYCQGFTGWYLLRNKRKLSSKIGVNFHGINMFQKAFGLRNVLQNFMFRPFVRLNLKSADIVFSLGGEITRILTTIGVNAKNIIEQYNGIDESWLASDCVTSYSKCSITKLLFVGRNDRVKGLSEIIKVIEDSESNVVLNIVGQNGLSTDKIKYHGVVTNEMELKTIYQNCDALIVNSYSEGMPTVIIEAMACCKPIISTKVGAVEVLVDESNGILIVPGNSLSLQKAIYDFIELSHEQCLNMGEHSRNKVINDFLWHNIVKRSIEKLGLSKK